MNRDYSYNRLQLLYACFVMLLSPALRLVPVRSAELSGASAWLAPAAALPMLLIYALFLCRFTESRSAGEGIDMTVRRCLGRRLGNAVLLVTALWLMIYCAFILRSGAERMITTIYKDASPAVFILTMAVLALAAALSSELAIMRAAKIIVPIMSFVLLLVLISAVQHISAENLLPLNSFEVLYSLKGAVVTVDVTVLPMYLTLFLGDERSDPEGNFRSCTIWLIAIVLLLCAIEICVVGTFGSALTAELSHPFFSLIRNLVLFRSLERIEALVVSLWVFSDFILVAVCISASQRILRGCLGKRCNYAGEKMLEMKNGRWLIWMCTIFAAIFALVFAPNLESMELWSDTIIPYANLTFAFLLLPAVYITGKIRKKI